MLKTRELKTKETQYISMKLPVELYEFFRVEAFGERKSISLLIQEALEQFKQEKEREGGL